jgi:glyoxylase-like metal-dependent hydrolase (beta-lactamase superfamily II)
VVLFPLEDTVACGDLAFAGYHYNYGEANGTELPARLEELAALPVWRFIPGHGPAGGREVVLEQGRYHAEVPCMVRSATSPAVARAAIEALLPDRALRDAIPTAITAFSGSGGKRPTWA